MQQNERKLSQLAKSTLHAIYMTDSIHLIAKKSTQFLRPTLILLSLLHSKINKSENFIKDVTFSTLFLCRLIFNINTFSKCLSPANTRVLSHLLMVDECQAKRLAARKYEYVENMTVICQCQNQIT